MEAAEKIDGPAMMYGTNGYKDYLAIARNGNVALGIKPNMITSGSRFGRADCVWFGARLRSAWAEGVFENDSDGNVVKLQKKFESLTEPWPGVEWEKQNSSRASTTIGALIRGSLEGTRDQARELLNQLKDGTIARKLADYLFELVGSQNMILSRDEVASWLTDNVYGKVAEQIEKNLQAKEIVEQEMEQSIGTFGMQAAILKKAYAKVNEGMEEAEDLSDETGDEGEAED